MLSRKKYIYLAIIAFVCLLSMALTCNQCEAEKDEEEKIDVGIGETATAEEELAEEESSTEENDDGGKVEPTINLEIYEGPTSAPEGICFYRVEALVTGNPEPEVDFSKDDSNGSWGPKKAQVNLTRGETYTLKATATNSEGVAEDSITLSWDCNGESDEEENISSPISSANNYPKIIEIRVSNANIAVSEAIEVEAIAEDPDGDSLSYKWIASEGSFEDKNAKRTKYIAPNKPGSHVIVAQVFDGNGGVDTESKTIKVGKD